MTDIALAQSGHEEAGRPDAAPQGTSNLSEFLPFLEGYEMSLEAKLAFLSALYDMLATLVDQALGEEPHQNVLSDADGDASPSPAL